MRSATPVEDNMAEFPSAGISQRDYTAFYSHLPPHREAIRREIMDFFQLKIAGRFPSTNCEYYSPLPGGLKHCEAGPIYSKIINYLLNADVFDVYREEEVNTNNIAYNLAMPCS